MRSLREWWQRRKCGPGDPWIEFDHPPVRVNKQGVHYVRPSELMRSRAFWEQVEKTRRLWKATQRPADGADT